MQRFKVGRIIIVFYFDSEKSNDIGPKERVYLLELDVYRFTTTCVSMRS